MSIKKTYTEINEKIKKGKAVVLTAEEIIQMVDEKGLEKTAAEVDVVTTGTFGMMCSSGAFLNFGHPEPKIKMSKVWLNGVNAYAGIAAVDAYLGATELQENDPENKLYPGKFPYGGGHVIEDLVAGKEIRLEAVGYGTDCYPLHRIETVITLKDINDAFLFNPRNAFQNYVCAVNLSSRTIYTYMGKLKPNLGNVSYSTSGQLSPLLNDPLYRTIGIGTRIFLGGGIGYVAWTGTQFNPNVPRTENGVPVGPGGGLAVIGDLKQMKPEWLRGTSILGYGTNMAVGIGVPIPILDVDMLRQTAVKDEDIYTKVVDFSGGPADRKKIDLGTVNYAQLRGSKVVINGKEVPTTPVSSYIKAREIAELLKEWIQDGDFLLTEPVQNLPGPGSNIEIKALKEIK